jgi:hypothetical protein
VKNFNEKAEKLLTELDFKESLPNFEPSFQPDVHISASFSTTEQPELSTTGTRQQADSPPFFDPPDGKAKKKSESQRTESGKSQEQEERRRKVGIGRQP